MHEQIIGKSQAIQHVRELIDCVSNTNLNVVITGESGVGKELVAQHLYLKSSRSGRPFVKVNCSALPDTLLESELFGYVPGAFTGANRKKRGKFEVADGGVLFLDEIGDMSLPLQSKLLHVIESKEFCPLGAEKDVKTDAWVIAATNHNLEQAVSEKKFRKDLYHRFNIIKIYIPPLRKRPEDIPLLVSYFVDQYSPLFKSGSVVTRDHVERLARYAWPGNVRELQNVLKRLMVLDNCDEIIDELEIASISSKAASSSPIPAWLAPEMVRLQDGKGEGLLSFSLRNIKKKAIDQVEKEVISAVLDKTDWNRSNASKVLKISYRSLLYKIDELKIKPSIHSRDHTEFTPFI